MTGNSSSEIFVAQPCANLLEKPKQGSQLLSQYLLGDTFRVMRKSGNYLRVETNDDLEGWVHHGAVSSESFNNPDADKLICTSNITTVKEKAEEDSRSIMHLFLGTVLDLEEPLTNYYLKGREWLRISLPQQKTGFIKKKSFAVYTNYVERHFFKPQTVVRWADYLLGTYYLWGGTTSVALDCSGLSRLAFRMAGVDLPRNSYRQAETGKAVEISGKLEELEPADLIFFKQGDRIDHVGISVGGNHFIHSSLSYGRTVISSFNDQDLEYDPLFQEIFTLAKRYDWKSQT